MALGFIIASKDAGGVTTGYWDGTEFIDSATPDAIDSSNFIETETDARFVQGSIQAANTAFDVVKIPAESNIAII